MKNSRWIACALCYGIFCMDGYKLKASTEHNHTKFSKCRILNTISDVVKCAISQHPDSQRSEYELLAAKSLPAKSLQVVNPELSIKYLKEEQASNNNLEASLSFPVDLRGRRALKAQKDKKYIDVLEARKSQSAENIKIKVILLLHRLRQLNLEKGSIAMTIKGYNKIIAKLKSLPNLSAQQSATLYLFEIAVDDFKVQESNIFEEYREIEHFFEVSTGHSLSAIELHVPTEPKLWPDILKQEAQSVSSRIKELKAIASISNANLEIESSSLFSDFKIGPSFAVDNSSEYNNTSIGLNIKFSLPTSNLNGAARSYARKKFLSSQNNIKIEKFVENHDRTEQLRVYKSAVQLLNTTMDNTQIKNRYKKIEKLYLRGIVAREVYLDSQKQKTDLIKARHKKEYIALKALWNIRKIDGKVLEEKI